MSDGTRLTVDGRLVHVKVPAEPPANACYLLNRQIAEHVERHCEIGLVLENYEAPGRCEERPPIQFWENVLSDFKFWSCTSRLALVGDPRWALFMATLCSFFTPVKMRHFEHTDLTKAVHWASEPDRIRPGMSLKRALGDVSNFRKACL